MDASDFMVFKVVSWFLMVFGWFPWFFQGRVMVFGWFPWFFQVSFMVFTWFPMVFGWFSWFFKVGSWFLVGFHSFSR